MFAVLQELAGVFGVMLPGCIRRHSGRAMSSVMSYTPSVRQQSDDVTRFGRTRNTREKCTPAVTL